MTVDGAVRPFSPGEIAEALDVCTPIIVSDATLGQVAAERGLPVELVRMHLVLVADVAAERLAQVIASDPRA